MAEDDTDYKAEYEKMKAERDALGKALDDKLTELNKANADLLVAQRINKATVGTSTDPPAGERKKLSMAECREQYIKNMNK